MIYLLLLCCLLPQEPTATEVLVQKAETAQVIQSEKYVEVILGKPSDRYNGFLITVFNPSKFVRVKAQKDLFTVISPKQLNDNQWLFTAPPGTYAITITQFDPDKGIDEKYLKVVIGEEEGEEEEVPPPPPLPSFDRVVKLAPADVETTLRLIEIFKTETDPLKVRQRREEVMRTRNFQYDWNPFIRALNEELAKTDYIKGIRAVAVGLESRISVVCTNGVCTYQMK